MRKCARCGTFGSEDVRLTKLEDHHLIPKEGWEGQEIDNIVVLCERCHDILHHKLLAHVGFELKRESKLLWIKMREKIKQYSLRWIKHD